ncbi:hypothetical protein ACH4E8_25990 [Streptomyces sp. NPDC017979]|uniref:hypothetical protein n=1 Tax=Streptomyces sp. NPDC017979 TaxID=3365024 RepID=UPI003796DDB5
MSDTAQVLPRAMRAAVGLAARYFPLDEQEHGRRTVTRADVLFVLDGHIADWAEWRKLPVQDARQFTRLFRRRPNVLANAESAGRTLDRLLGLGGIPGCTATEDYGFSGAILVDPGMPLPEFVDGALDELDALHRQVPRTRQPAQPGPHSTTTRVRIPGGTDKTYVDHRYEIREHHRSSPQPLASVQDAQPEPHLSVPFADLRRIAQRIDEAALSEGGSAYRLTAVERFVDQIRDEAGQRVNRMDLTSGNVNQLLAYTGFGKSVVLVETLACWVVQQGVSAAFVLPTNADIVRVTHQIERALTLFGSAAQVVPLVSPRSLIKVAGTAATRVSESGPDTDWIWRRFGYGCALSAVASTENGVDAWQPGREPCSALRRTDRRGRARTVACPWRTSCGRFRAARQACTADVIVTSHQNLLSGVLQTPVEDGNGANDRLTVEELVLRRCQLVVIDEIDVFQQVAIESAGRGLVLDHGGSTNTPLRRLDQDFGAAFGRLHDEVDASVRDAYFGLRYLSENYVSHLAYERLGAAPPAGGRRHRGPARSWMVPRRWDNWLTGKVFGVEPSEVSLEQVTMLRSLFLEEQSPLPGEPTGFGDVREHLAQVVTVGTGGQAVAAARTALGNLVPDLDEPDRGRFANRVLRRAILERIRMYLHVLMANNVQLVDNGVESAQEIADRLGTYGRWRLTPTGPLGRLVFAFTEHFDDTRPDSARLTTAAFGGDPHVYTVTLGDTTALALAGVRRIVLGLSATSYFPGAPHHHVHMRPRWWVADNAPDRVRVEAASVLDEESGRLERISGLEGPERARATLRVAEGLWRRHLRAELDRLKVEDKDRARVLLATTSYDAARLMAEGLSSAGVAAERICLAVRPRTDETYDASLETTGRWRELPADRLEDFPAMSGADILIAPLARVQRGVNIIGAGDKSALGSVWLVVRPIPLMDEPSELVAHIQARALALHPGPTSDPRALLADRRTVAGNYLEKIIRRPPYFQAQPLEVKLAVTAEMINGAIQLIGRARRGGTSSVLHLVDGAILDPVGGSDLATLIVKLREGWRRDGVLAQLCDYYGTTLQAFFDYADRHTTGASKC